jgi:hypothetical protein
MYLLADIVSEGASSYAAHLQFPGVCASMGLEHLGNADNSLMLAPDVYCQVATQTTHSCSHLTSTAR